MTRPPTTRVDGPTRVARACIARTLGVDVELWDTAGRQRAHDLRFEWDGRVVAVEAKLVVEPRQREAEAAAGTLGYTKDPRLTSTWTIDLQHKARFRKAHRELPELLVRAEAAGWLGGDNGSLRPFDSALHESMSRLGVTAASRLPPTAKHPPGFYVMPEGWGGAVSSVQALPKFVERILAGRQMSTLRRQLLEANADERHAFLFIGWEHMEAVCLADSDDELPSARPSLPDPINGIWLAATTSDSRVIAWLPRQGWTNAERISQMIDCLIALRRAMKRLDSALARRGAHVRTRIRRT